MTINRTDLDRHITGDFGERQFEGMEDEETPDMEEERYANARKVSILEFLDALILRDERITVLENKVASLERALASTITNMHGGV